MSAYCSQSDVESIMSEVGVDLHADDRWPLWTEDPGSPISPAAGDTATAIQYVTEAIERASAKIDMGLGMKFEPSSFPSSDWVKWCCAYLAACEIFRRRGNSIPDSILSQCEYYTEIIDRVMSGEIGYIPDLTPRHEPIPAMSNLRVDNRYVDARIRVQQVVSAGRTDSSKPRHVDVYGGTGWARFF